MVTTMTMTTTTTDDDDEEPFIFKYTRTRKEDGAMEIVEEQWSADHARILYLMSLYAKCSTSPTETEGWIRQVPLLVLLYEGIVQTAIDFDYAPCSMLISQDGRSRRVWLNVTQEGRLQWMIFGKKISLMG